jgi:hypothetical protein
MDILPIQTNATLAGIVDRVEWAMREAQNANSSGGGPDSGVADRIDRYLRWTEDAEPQLRNVFRPEYAAELVKTTGYWTLRTVSPDALRVNTLVRTEYEGLIGEFERLLTDLAAEKARWERKTAPLLVPDTSMFLDPENLFATVDWPALAESEIDVRVVTPLIVVHELDRLKRQGNSTTARLAREAIRFLSVVLPADVEYYSAPFRPGPPGSTIEVYVHGGPTRPEDADGVIIEFGRWLGVISGLPTTLVTRDLGMALRARSIKVEAIHIRP